MWIVLTENRTRNALDMNMKPMADGKQASYENEKNYVDWECSETITATHQHLLIPSPSIDWEAIVKQEQNACYNSLRCALCIITAPSDYQRST